MNPSPEIYQGEEEMEETEPVSGSYEREAEKEKRPFTPTFPSSEINIQSLHDGLRWGECRLPLSFDLNADLPPDRSGQAGLEGDHVKVEVDNDVPSEFRHVIAYHELIEAEGLSNGYTDGSSHPIACEMEARYINTFLSEPEKSAFRSLYGDPNSFESRNPSLN